MDNNIDTMIERAKDGWRQKGIIGDGNYSISLAQRGDFCCGAIGKARIAERFEEQNLGPVLCKVCF